MIGQDPESVDRIEPARLEDVSQAIADVATELAATAGSLGSRLHPITAANLASVVQILSTHYSRLIEGDDTRPVDIERALNGQLDAEQPLRNRQIEAVALARVRAEIDRMAAEGRLLEPASRDFILWLHRDMYRDVPRELLRIAGPSREIVMEPGKWRSRPEHDVRIGRHAPPSSARIAAFMEYFEQRYRFANMGKAARIAAMAASHHRFSYIHPFPDGNGRVGRLMSHAMVQAAGIGAHGLWSISRGLALGLKDRNEYKQMMDRADTPRQGDLDGRGNLSSRALAEFTMWFLEVCLSQAKFMSDLFDLNNLVRRLRIYAERNNRLKPEAGKLLEEALIRGELERGDVARITGLPERSARRVLNDAIAEGLLASQAPKGPVSLRFPTETWETLFPGLCLDI